MNYLYISNLTPIYLYIIDLYLIPSLDEKIHDRVFPIYVEHFLLVLNSNND